jgi:hypothetical protein
MEGEEVMRAMLVACGIVGVALSLVAQSPPGRSVTFTGCLEGMLTGHLLTRVQQGAGIIPADRAAAGVVVASSRATGSMPRPIDDSIVTRSDGSVNLDQHVNHRIKVTGTLEEPTNVGGRERVGTSPDIRLAVLTVTSVQTVSTTCP